MEHRLDELARALAGGLSRREALRRLGGGLAAACLASLGLGKAWGQSGSVDCGTWCQGAVGFDPKNAASRERFAACVPSCDHCQADGGKVCGTTASGSAICCEQTDTCCGTGCCPAGQECCGATCCAPGQVCQNGDCVLPVATCCSGDRLLEVPSPDGGCVVIYGHSGPCELCRSSFRASSTFGLYAPGNRTEAECAAL